MKTQIRFALLVLVPVIALTAATERAAMGYEYVLSQARDYGGDHTPYDSTSTHTEAADGSGYATLGGTCTANAWTGAWAKYGDSATPDASADASWGRSWEWDGPPGEAPGGSLSWSYSGHGNISASGQNSYVDDGGALSVASFSGSNSGGGSGGGGWASGSASGYVYDEDLGSASAQRTGDPEPEGNEPVEDTSNGSYSASIDWNNSQSGPTDITSGTASVYFSGGASCNTYSGAGAGPFGSYAQASANTSGGVTTSLSADFSSN